VQPRRDNRGFTWHALRRYEQAKSDFEQAIYLDSEHPNAYKNYAWLLATCPDPAFRNGRRAVELATKAHELTAWQQVGWYHILAAAYAESGEFPAAIDWQQKAVKAAPEDEQDEQQSRLDRYASESPYHEQDVTTKTQDGTTSR
jgi:serine/threonine-protein kinase